MAAVEGPAATTRADKGSGGGFGLSASPVGAYVIKDGKVTWMPAVDVNRVIIGGQLVAILMLLTFRGMMRRRMRQRWAEKTGERHGPGRRFGPRHD